MSKKFTLSVSSNGGYIVLSAEICKSAEFLLKDFVSCWMVDKGTVVLQLIGGKLKYADAIAKTVKKDGSYTLPREANWHLHVLVGDRLTASVQPGNVRLKVSSRRDMPS